MQILDFQTRIGDVDIKSKPVYFYVHKNKPFSTLNVPIPFDVEILNVGGAMNLGSGIFTAPKSGTYYFSFIGNVVFQSGQGGNFEVTLFKNKDLVAVGWVDSTSSATDWKTFPLQATIKLRKGDKISLQITMETNGVFIIDYPKHYYTQYMGWLIDEHVAEEIDGHHRDEL